MIKAIPDPEFAANFPDEIQYKPEKIIMEFLPKSIDMNLKPQKQEIANITNKWDNNQIEWVIPVNYSYKSFTLFINNLHRIDAQSFSIIIPETIYFQHSRKIFVYIK